MSTSALIPVIVLAYVSLGLPDTLLGAAWPVMRLPLGASLEAAGAVSLVIASGTTVSSLLSSRLLARFGTGPVAFGSVLATALALLGFSLASTFWTLLLCAVPLGLGAGAVDAGLNHFVAARYRPRALAFLHGCWGLGAMSGPGILSWWIARAGISGWALGYRTVSFLQLGLVAVLGLSLPLWRRLEPPCPPSAECPEVLSNRRALALPGVKTGLAALFCYCALELAAGLWAGSFLVEARGVDPETAALCASLYYGSIALGRMLTGLLGNHLTPREAIRLGLGLCAAGALLLGLPLPLPGAVCGLALLGLGCAPLTPSMLAETPRRYGEEASRTVMGLQMATSYLGSAVVPPLLGLGLARGNIPAFPAFLLGAVGVTALLRERLNRLPVKK